jgi:hypothetical protein
LVSCIAALTTEARSLPHDRKQGVGRGIVTEGLGYMREEIDVSGAENEASAKLKGMLPVAMLPVSGLPCPGSGPGIVATEDVKQGSDLQFCSMIGFPVLINQQGKANTRLVAKIARVADIAEPHRG